MKNYSEIVCVIDRSGSMGILVNDAIGGFNTFLEDQKKVPGDATLTYVQFNHDYEVIHENIPIQDVKPIDHDTYIPFGTTALLDAVGKTIDRVGRRLDSMDESLRPAKVIFAILTDGEENSSTQYSLSRVKDMITHQKDVYNWEFIFLASNQDAFLEAGSLGIDKKDTFTFLSTSKGLRSAYDSMGASISSYRSDSD